MAGHIWPGEDPVVVTLQPDVQPDGLLDLRFHLHEVVLTGACDIVIDASCIDELPSAVIGALLTAHRACRSRGGHVVIRYPSRRALDQLRRTGLWRVFQIEPASPRTPHFGAR
jgi:anti-anti-sigma regulatory factor